jgi:hypothetical protein
MIAKPCKIELVTQYKDGTTIKENTREIFASVKSVARNEFYSAYAMGLRLKYIFVIHSWEFSIADYPVTTDEVTTTYRPTHIRYEDELFEIVRTYEVERGQLEITVK